MTLHLCAILLRGETTFTIAKECAEMGTASDPGPWWITTMGLRIYPFWSEELKSLGLNLSYPGECEFAPILSEVPPPPDDAIDSCAYFRKGYVDLPIEEAINRGQKLLTQLGLLKPKAPLIRRF